MPETRWRIVQVTDLTGRRVRNLNVYVTVDTTAPSVIGPIEKAAREAGIILQPLINGAEPETVPGQITVDEAIEGFA